MVLNYLEQREIRRRVRTGPAGAADDGPSTYERPDFVLHDDLDHTSVLKLLQEKWNLTPPRLPEPKGGPFKR